MEELLSTIQIIHLLSSQESGKRALIECKNDLASEHHPSSDSRNWRD
jgi:hypothetical protein